MPARRGKGRAGTTAPGSADYALAPPRPTGGIFEDKIPEGDRIRRSRLRTGPRGRGSKVRWNESCSERRCEPNRRLFSRAGSIVALGGSLPICSLAGVP